MDVAAGLEGFLFEVIDQPQAFGDVEAAVEEVAVEDQVTGAEGPFVGRTHDAVIDEQVSKGDKVALDIRDSK